MLLPHCDLNPYRHGLQKLLLGVLFIGIWLPTASATSPKVSVGVLPFHATYPNDAQWFGLFLQDTLLRQLRQVTHTPSMPLMDLWQRYFQLQYEQAPSTEQLQSMQINLLIRGRFQKVWNHILIDATIDHLDSKQKLAQTPWKQRYAKQTPEQFIHDILKDLAKTSVLPLVEAPNVPWPWESVEAFYRWRAKPLPKPSSKEWNSHRKELEALLDPFPELESEVFATLAVLSLAEGMASKAQQGQKLEEAKQFVQKALVVNPNSTELHALLAEIYYFTNEAHLAKSEAVIANAKNASNSLALLIYGLSISNHSGEGKSQLEKALRLNPFFDPSFAPKLEHPAIYQLLHEALGSWQAPPEAPKPKEKNLTLKEPEESLAYQRFLKGGITYFDKEEWSKAYKHFRRAMRESPKALKPQLYIARIFLMQQRYEAATQLLEQLNRNYPDQSNVLLYLGKASEVQDELAKAEDYYRQSLFLDEKNPETLLRLGTTLVKLDQLDEAEDFLEQSAGLDPMKVTAWWNLGLLHWKQKEWKDAKEAWEQALQLEPDNPKFQEYFKKLNARLNPPL